MKHDLLPTEERLFTCGKAPSPRCKRCSRIDVQGHFLMCLGLKAVTDPIISALRLLEPDVSLEKVVLSNMTYV